MDNNQAALPYIDQAAIEGVITLWEDGQRYTDQIQSIMENYPVITGFLLQESTDILREEEKDTLWLVAATLLYLLQALPIRMVTEEQLSLQEEHNWNAYQAEKEGTFYDRITPFYEDYPQEDLLAFVEDMVQVDEEDGDITKIGREVIFITCKTLIDVLLSSQSKEDGSQA